MPKKKIRKKKYYVRNAGVTATFSMSLVLFLIGLLALSLFLTRDMTNFVKENLNLSCTFHPGAYGHEHTEKNNENLLLHSK